MQQDNNQPTQFFKEVLATAATLTDAHIDQLQTLLYSFPQSGLLHAIQARTGTHTHLTEAAAWFGNSHLLHKVVKSPQNLAAVTNQQIIIRQKPLEKFSEPEDTIQLEQEVLLQEEPAETLDQPAFSAVEPQILAIDEVLGEPQAYPETEASSAEPNREPPFAPPIFKPEPFDETQKLIVESLAANDYFVFDKAFADRNQMEPEVIKPQILAEPQPQISLAKPADEGSVTRYHDDKMPYSFLWWLDKTRNKHSQVYQPFANPVTQSNGLSAEPENHIKDVLEDRTKEEEIVERFIQEEPQMRPPSGDKLDNENKARHSVEDQEELITETLARIYADQMLYSKAIAAYKILVLKNPEKRRYFASQIEVLEKKIN